MDTYLLAQTTFPAQFRAALTATASSTEGTPVLGAREMGDAPAPETTPSTSTADQLPYNAGYDTGRGYVAAGGVALAVLIIVLLFAVVVTSRHHEHE